MNMNNTATLPISHTQAATQPHQYKNSVDGPHVPEYLALERTEDDKNDNSRDSVFQGQGDNDEQEEDGSNADSTSTHEAYSQEIDANLASDSTTHACNRHTEEISNQAHENVTGENGEGLYSDFDEHFSVNYEMNENCSRLTDGSGGGGDVDYTIYLARQGAHWTIKRCYFSTSLYCILQSILLK